MFDDMKKELFFGDEELMPREINAQGKESAKDVPVNRL
jgi:hypothetical protein